MIHASTTLRFWSSICVTQSGLLPSFSFARSAGPPSAALLESAGLPPRYGTVLALNVLDRVDHSRAYLAALLELVLPGGRLVVALPLPYCAKPWEAERAGGESREVRKRGV